MKASVGLRVARVCAELFMASVTITQGADIALFDFALNQDGLLTVPPASLPPGSMFDTTSGLGSIRIEAGGVGTHSVLLFVDHDISEAINSYTNELAMTLGTRPAGLSWEIDEPGFVFGDIYNNLLRGTLDNSNGLDVPQDVSMALGWSFMLSGSEHAFIDFLLSDIEPGGFYLRHYDPDSGESLYFTSSITIVPESYLNLWLAGLLWLLIATTWRRRAQRKLHHAERHEQ